MVVLSCGSVGGGGGDGGGGGADGGCLLLAAARVAVSIAAVIGAIGGCETHSLRIALPRGGVS